MSINEWMRLLELLLLPPGLIVWVGLLIVAIGSIRPRIFSRLFALALLITGLLSMPVVSQKLIDGFQDDFPPLQKLPPDADVIVVLGGGIYDGGKEYGIDGQPGPATLQRMVYAAWLARQNDLPVVISEARTPNERRTGAHGLATFAHQVLGIKNVIVEGRATSTFENARFTSKILKNYRKPVLVTNYWHMARSVESFMYFGVNPVPAPTARSAQPYLKSGWWRWVPQARALEQSYTALHEWMGYYWYRFKVFSNGAPPAQHD